MWTSFIGFMACGKSTVAQTMAQATSLPVKDLDREIERSAGMTIPEIFANGGVDEFRLREAAALSQIDADVPLLLAVGGGAVENKQVRDWLRQRGVVIWLDAPWEVLRKRIEEAGVARRPMVGHLGWDGMKSLYHHRLRLYADTADFRLRTDRAGVSVIATEAMSRGLLWQRQREGG